MPDDKKHIVIDMGDLMPVSYSLLQGVVEGGVDIDDVLSEVVYHLNNRTRPLIIDLLFERYNFADLSEDIKFKIEYIAYCLSNKLDAHIPEYLRIIDFRYVGTDIMLETVTVDDDCYV